MGSMQQCIQQILRLGLCLFPPLAYRSRHRRRLSGQAREQDLEVAGDQVGAQGSRKTKSPLPTILVGEVVHLHKQIFHVRCPRLFELLKDCRQVSQEVGTTDALVTVIVVITTEPVPHEASLIERQDPDLVHGYLPSALMPLQMVEKGSTVDMKPMQFLADMDPRFVLMHQSRGS